MNVLQRLWYRQRLKRCGIAIDDVSQLNKQLTVDIESPCFLNGVRLSSPDRDIRHIGRYSYFRSGGRFTAFSRIGRFCSIARDVKIGERSHPLDWISTHPFTVAPKYTGCTDRMLDISDTVKPAPTLGNDVWIGVNAIVLEGVSIGDGAVIAAGAVVTRDVAPYAVVGGVPAKLIRYRFSDAIIRELLAIRWWDYDPGDLIQFECQNVPRFIEQFKAAKLTPLIGETFRVGRQGRSVTTIDDAATRHFSTT